MITVTKRQYKDKKTGKMKLTQTYSFRYRKGNMAKWKSTGLTRKRDAERYALDWMASYKSTGVVPKTTEPISIDDLYQLMLDDYAREGKKSTETLSYRFKHLKPFFKNYDASDIDTALVNKYVKRRNKNGASASTIRVELGALARALNLAFEEGKLQTKQTIKLPKGGKPKKEFFTKIEYEAIVANLKEPYRSFVHIAYHIGCRRSEIFNLKFKDLDFKNNLVSFRNTKNGTDRQAPMYGNIREVLLDARKRALKGGRYNLENYVFINKVGKPFHTLSTPWKTATKKAGCPDKVFHSFRRTACRNMINAGIPESTACLVTGWQDRRSMDRYNIKSISDYNLHKDKYESHVKGLGGKLKEDAENLM